MHIYIYIVCIYIYIYIYTVYTCAPGSRPRDVAKKSSGFLEALQASAHTPELSRALTMSLSHQGTSRKDFGFLRFPFQPNAKKQLLQKTWSHVCVQAGVIPWDSLSNHPQKGYRASNRTSHTDRPFLAPAKPSSFWFSATRHRASFRYLICYVDPGRLWATLRCRPLSCSSGTLGYP